MKVKVMNIVAVHLSAASALPMVKAAKAEGLPLTVETCHHYLRSIIRLMMSSDSDEDEVEQVPLNMEICLRLLE